MKNPLEQGRRRKLRPLLGGSRKVVIGLLASLTAIVAQAQEFSVPWFSIDGGGGFSGGGVYALFGTVGQPDAAAPSAGGGYTLTAGFVPGLGARQAAPLLTIDSSNPGQVRLAWEDPDGVYVLQEAPMLDAAAWKDASGGGKSPVVASVLETGTFYRLRRR